MQRIMPQEYTISELAKLAGVTPRTIRYYVAQGLLPAPTQPGPAARYTEAHLGLLRAIKKLQAAHLPLAEIRGQLGRMPEEEIDALRAPPGGLASDDASAGTALDYIRQVLSPARVVGKPPTLKRHFAIPLAPQAVSSAATPGSPPAPTAPTVPPAPTAPTVPTVPPAQPATMPATTSQWERVSLHPDIELHVRRPLTRQLNKRVEQLIQIARSLLEEE